MAFADKGRGHRRLVHDEGKRIPRAPGPHRGELPRRQSAGRDRGACQLPHRERPFPEVAGSLEPDPFHELRCTSEGLPGLGRPAVAFPTDRHERILTQPPLKTPKSRPVFRPDGIP